MDSIYINNFGPPSVPLLADSMPEPEIDRITREFQRFLIKAQPAEVQEIRFGRIVVDETGNPRGVITEKGERKIWFLLSEVLSDPLE